MEKDLAASIADAKAIVFVEGETDVDVFTEFATKLQPEPKISFFDLEGYGYADYHPEARLSRLLNIPMFLIFDGHIPPEKRRKIEKRLSRNKVKIGPSHIMTLKKNSIEDYLLVPRAIKSAYPSIPKSIQDIALFVQKYKDQQKKEESSR